MLDNRMIIDRFDQVSTKVVKDEEKSHDACLFFLGGVLVPLRYHNRKKLIC